MIATSCAPAAPRKQNAAHTFAGEYGVGTIALPAWSPRPGRPPAEAPVQGVGPLPGSTSV
jgi:hypothetical protein